MIRKRILSNGYVSSTSKESSLLTEHNVVCNQIEKIKFKYCYYIYGFFVSFECYKINRNTGELKLEGMFF